MSETREIKSYSVCSHDGAPLVTSFEVPFTEWLCITCGRRYAMFGTVSASATPELHEAYADARQRYLDRERPPVAAGEVSGRG